MTATAMTNYLEDLLLNAVLRAVSLTSPAALYVALFTAAPGEAGGGTEVSTSGGSAYTRQPVTFDAPSSNACANSGDLVWTAAGANWGTVTDIAIMDAPTGGNMLFKGALTATKAVTTGVIFRILAGQLTVALD